MQWVRYARWINGSVAVCLVLGFVFFLVYDANIVEPRATVMQNVLYSASRRISPPSSSLQETVDIGHKWAHAWVHYFYTDPMSYPQLQAYYTRQFANDGWFFCGTHTTGFGVRETEVRFRKQDVVATLSFVPTESRPDRRKSYGLALEWDAYFRLC